MTDQPAKNSNKMSPLVTVLGLLTVCCWGSFGGLLGLASVSFEDGATAPPASQFPEVAGVSISPGYSGGYCGSGGCFSTVLFAQSSDGAPRSVTVNRLVSELNRLGWHVVETDYFEETRIAADGPVVGVSFNWAEDPKKGTEDDHNHYDANTVVKIVMDWTNENYSTGAEAESFRPGTFFGNWLIVAGLLTLGTGAALVGRSRRRRSLRLQDDGGDRVGATSAEGGGDQG